jgi:hypothetical protein
MSGYEFSLETVKQIWNDSTGDRIEIGPDMDSLGLFEIRSFNESKVIARIVFTYEEAALIVKAINDLLVEKEKGIG